MRTPLQLAENAEIVGTHRHRQQYKDNIVSVDEFIEDGILYLTFASLSCEDFAKSYTMLHAFGDILHRPCNRDSFANPNFWDDWKAIKKAVFTLANRDRSMPIVLSGHGIGGSIALIAGYDLIKKGYTIKRVTTFGAPRAINQGKAIPLITYPLSLVTIQYVLPGDRYPKMFKFTRYKNINRTELDSWPLQKEGVYSEIPRDEVSYSSIDAYIKCLEVHG